MKKIFIVLFVILFLCSCHEIGIRNYKNEVAYEEFIEKYTEAFNASYIETFKERDYVYYWDYDYEENIPMKNSKDQDVFETIYQYVIFELSHDVDNKVFKNEYEDIYSGKYFKKYEGDYSYYLNDKGETIKYDNDKKEESISVYQYNDIYTNCNAYLLSPKNYENFNKENYKFYIDKNTFTSYYYEKNKSEKYEHAVLRQITYKNNKVCYYEVDEELNDGHLIKKSSYMEFLFKNIIFDNKFIV